MNNSKHGKWWFVDGVRYDGSYHAAEKIGVNFTTIRNWCEGYTQRGKYYLPKPN